MEPTGNGIGGDLFAIVWDAKNPEALRTQWQWPRARGAYADAAARRTREAQADGQCRRAASCRCRVPGAVDAWFTLHQRFGRLPMSELLKPVIAYAREGVSGLRSHRRCDGAQCEGAGPVPGFSRNLHA